MTQPTFVPIPTSAEVRPTYPTPAPELNRPAKAGLLRHVPRLQGAGTPAPDAGFALSLARRVVHGLELERPADRHDLELAVALLAQKRASRQGRGPAAPDVTAALAALGAQATPVPAQVTRPLSGLAHDYFAQRSLVDGIDDEVLETR